MLSENGCQKFQISGEFYALGKGFFIIKLFMSYLKIYCTVCVTQPQFRASSLVTIAIAIWVSEGKVEIVHHQARCIHRFNDDRLHDINLM